MVRCMVASMAFCGVLLLPLVSALPAPLPDSSSARQLPHDYCAVCNVERLAPWLRFAAICASTIVS